MNEANHFQCTAEPVMLNKQILCQHSIVVCNIWNILGFGYCDTDDMT
jgi:hypothetical protein